MLKLCETHMVAMSQRRLRSGDVLVEKGSGVSLAGGKIRRFGLISTRASGQSFNRRVVADAMSWNRPVHLAFAIPNHPWVDSRGVRGVESP